MDITFAEWIAAIADTELKTAVEGLVLPADMPMAEFLIKLLEAANSAAKTKNGSLTPGSAGYIASYPAPIRVLTPATAPGGQQVRTTCGVVVSVPLSLDNVLTVNQ